VKIRAETFMEMIHKASILQALGLKHTAELVRL